MTLSRIAARPRAFSHGHLATTTRHQEALQVIQATKRDLAALLGTPTAMIGAGDRSTAQEFRCVSQREAVIGDRDDAVIFIEFQRILV
jgi:hypothetical protein